MEKLTRFAWAFGLAGFLALLTFLSLWFLNQSLSGPWTEGFGIGAGVLLVLYGVLDRQNLGRGVRSRAFRYGSGAMTMVLLAGVLGVVAFVVAKEHDTRWDWTHAHTFSLSDKTKKVVKALDKDVQIVAFFRSQSPERKKFEQLIQGYTQLSPHLEVTWFDPLLNPNMAQRFNITSENGTVVMQAGKDKQRLEKSFDEDAVTEALTKLESGVDHKICWSTGHGELGPDDDSSPDGLGGIVSKLEDMNYTVTKVNVFTKGIDKSCEALVIARPTKDWLPIERERLAVYLAEGGHAMVMFEPKTVPELAQEMHRYGVIVGNDIVIDPDPDYRIANVQDPTVFVISGDSLAKHPITEGLKGFVVMWQARSVKGDPTVKGVATHDLLQASKESWGETRLDIDPDHPDANPEALKPTKGEDLIGDVPMATAVQITDPSDLDVGKPAATADASAGKAGADEKAGVGLGLEDVASAVPADFTPKPGGRLVVFGDSSFASNQLYAVGNNQDLFTNSIAWLVNEKSQLGQGPKAKAQTLTMNLVEGLLVWLVSVFLVPGLAVALAIMVMLRRRFL